MTTTGPILYPIWTSGRQELVPPTGFVYWQRGDLGIIPNGANASAWNEQESGLDTSQATPANQPLIVSPWQNGIPALQFDAVSDILRRASGFFTAGQALTVFVVGQSAVNPDTVDIGTNNAPWWGYQSTAGNDAFFITRFNGATRTVAWTGGAGVTIAGTFGIGTSPAYLCWGTDGAGGAANLVFRANGVAKTTSGGLGNTTTASLNIFVGNGTGFAGKTIGEIIVYPSLLTTPQIELVEDYIREFWGLP